MIEVYTDGACKAYGTEDCMGGWAYVICMYGCDFSSYAGVPQTTNQRMELTAAIEALKRLEEMENIDNDIVLYSDSAYLINCYEKEWFKTWLTNGWVNAKKQPVSNRDLWEELIPYFNKENIKFVKIKGHAGHHYNEMVDSLAQKGAMYG